MKKNLCHVLLFLIGCLPLLAMTPKQTTPMDKPIYSVDFNGMNFCYNFIMPDHDVKLTWKSLNLMEKKE